MLSRASSQQDVEEIERMFEAAMEKDFNLLKDELKDEAKKVFFSAEMATALIGVAGFFFSSVAPPVASVGLTVAGGALYRKKIEYRAARNKALTNHSMSWLYAMKKLPVY